MKRWCEHETKWLKTDQKQLRYLHDFLATTDLVTSLTKHAFLHSLVDFVSWATVFIIERKLKHTRETVALEWGDETLDIQVIILLHSKRRATTTTTHAQQQQPRMRTTTLITQSKRYQERTIRSWLELRIGWLVGRLEAYGIKHTVGKSGLGSNHAGTLVSSTSVELKFI